MGNQITKGNCVPVQVTPLHDPHTSLNLDGKEACYLILREPVKRIVAEAIVYRQGTMVHHIKIGEDQLKVSVTLVRDGEANADLPFPNDEVVKLGNALGSFILWPRELVSTTPLVKHFAIPTYI